MAATFASPVGPANTNMFVYDPATAQDTGAVSTGIGFPISGASAGFATGTLTPAAVAANDTFAVAGITFTVKASPALVTDCPLAATNALQGLAIAQAINAHPTLAAFASADPVSGVVTVRYGRPGVAGNSIALAGTAVRLVASGATLAGGYDGPGTAGVNETDTAAADATVIKGFTAIGSEATLALTVKKV